MLYPFGMTMPGRNVTLSAANGSTSQSAYRYGFNGQEKSDEIFEGSTTALFWEYDSRIGRRWNVDPVLKISESSYLCFSGNPILLSDPFGDDNHYRVWNEVTKSNKLYTVKTNEHGDRYLPARLINGADLKNLKVTDFEIVGGAGDLIPNKGFEYDNKTDQFVKLGMAAKMSAPSQAPLNQKDIPAPAKTTNSNTTDAKKPVIEKVFDGAGAIGTTSQAIASGFIRAAKLAKSAGGVGSVPVGIPSSLSAKAPNIKILGRISAKTAINISKAADIIDKAGKLVSVASGIYNIVKDGKLTAGDAGVAALTYAQIAFPVFGLCVGIFDIGSMIFGYKGSADFIHEAIDGAVDKALKK
jgi:hypothetical protein